MQKLLTGLTLAAVAAAGLSTAAFARPGHGGPEGHPRMDPAMMEEMRAKRVTEVGAIDANGDGLISAEELANAEIARATERAHAHAAMMIERMDVDGDGLLSASELAVRPVMGGRGHGDAPPPPPEGEEAQ